MKAENHQPSFLFMRLCDVVVSRFAVEEQGRERCAILFQRAELWGASGQYHHISDSTHPRPQQGDYAKSLESLALAAFWRCCGRGRPRSHKGTFQMRHA
jgi:hypothetical protein